MLGENALGPLVAGGAVAFTVPRGTVTVRMRARRALSWSRQQVKRDGCHVEVQLLANPPNGFDKASDLLTPQCPPGPQGNGKTTLALQGQCETWTDGSLARPQSST